MSLFTGYLMLLIPITIINVLGLRFFALEFIYDEMNNFFDGSFTLTFIVTFALLLVATIIGYRITRPFQKIILRIKAGGADANPEETKICLSCYNKLKVLTIAANAVGFPIGQLIVTIIGLMTDSDFIFSRVFLVVAQATAFGLMGAISTISGLNYKLAPLRELLKVKTLENYKELRKPKVSGNITLVSIAILCFVIINLLTVPYSLLLNEGNEQMSNGTLLNTFLLKSILGIIVSIAYCILPFFYIIKGLRNRIKVTSTLLEDATQNGDIHSTINITMLDDFGDMTGKINKIMSQFSEIFKEVKAGANEVSDSAKNISTATTIATTSLSGISSSLSDINKASKEQEQLIIQAKENVNNLTLDSETVKKHVLEQASAIQQTSASVTEMSANINSVAQIADKANIVSQTLSETSRQGDGAVTLAITTMNEIQEASEQVQQMVELIQQLVSQTDLLSMNAAIEAAHAGNYGKGFAVVADEIRSLANSSAESTQEIQKWIKLMTEKIDAGVETINTAGVSFKSILESITENEELVKSISSAMDEQREGAKETIKSTDDVVQAIQSIRELAEKESTNAEKVQNFMQSVVEAAHNTISIVSNSEISAVNLKDSITKVDELVSNNSDTVKKMETLVNKYTV